MPAGLIRIISDLHYGERTSRVRRLRSLAPLFDGADSLILNGDTLDTRPGGDPAATRALREEVNAFFASEAPPSTFLSGNHDPDISNLHAVDLADGRLFVTHGDILFDSIVPWAQDASTIRSRLSEAFAALPPGALSSLEPRLEVIRAVAATIPQRHQAESRPIRHALGIAADTVWPPSRLLTVLQSWRQAPARARELARVHRPRAQFTVMGHTHRPGIWRSPAGAVVINTGSYCLPLGALAIDIEPARLRVRRVEARAGSFHLAGEAAVFALATGSN